MLPRIKKANKYMSFTSTGKKKIQKQQQQKNIPGRTQGNK